MARAAKWTFQPAWRRTHGKPWEPVLQLTAAEKGSDLAIVVDLNYDEAGPYVTGVSVRRHPLVGYEGGRTHVSARAVQRTSVAPVIKAALAYAEAMGTPLPRKPHPDEKPIEIVAAEKVLIPRGRPQHGKSRKFYEEIAAAHREYTLKLLSPAKEIARRKDVPENTVHQWFHRCRRMGIPL